MRARTAAFPQQGTQMALSQWLCAYPIFADTLAYRRYHLAHHAHTQQENDPDLVLSAPFPITKASYRRKFWRDITGRTGYEQRKAQLLNALGDPSWPVARRMHHSREKLGPQMAVNGVLLAGLSLAGIWWAYPLLWLVPLLTWMMVITRIRNIAEHAVVPDSNDPLRNTRTTQANLIERIFIAPYCVNYHLEHHLLFYVPCYNCRTACDSDERSACGAHGGAGWILESAETCDSQARPRIGPAPRQQCAPRRGGTAVEFRTERPRVFDEAGQMQRWRRGEVREVPIECSALVPAEGLEPPTYRLQGGCSTS